MRANTPTTGQFKAALEASGDYVLARRDRRDFVIIAVPTTNTASDSALA